MPNPPYLLCALVPPGSVEAEMSRLQEALFSEHGLVSAPAVPPLVPIAFVAWTESPAGLLQELNRSISSGWRIHLRGPAWIDRHLFARVQSDGAWETLHARAVERGGIGPGLFPVAEGFYLGCPEAADDLRPRIRPVIPVGSFSSALLAAIRFDPAGSSPWWRELHWEIIDQRPLRGRPGS